jgi:O-antigen/teichoic acid export membrane protein
MKSTFYKNFFILFSGTTLSQIIPFAAAFVIARIYTNEEFGFYGLFITIAGILSVFATLKYEVALLLADSEEKALHIMQTVFLIATLVSISLLVVIGIMFLLDMVSKAYFLLPLSVFAIAIYTSIDRYYNRFSHYKSMSILRINKSTGESVYNVLGTLSWFRPFNLILGFTGGYLLGIGYFLILKFQFCKLVVTSFSLRNVQSIMKEYKDFALYSFPLTLLNTVSTSIPVLLIPYYFDEASLGLYIFGFKYVQAPLSLISGSIYSVFGQELKDCMTDRAARIQIFNSLTKKLILLASLMVPFLVFAPFFFTFFFGENWTTSGKYIQILTLWIAVNFVMSALANIPVLFQKQRQALILEIVYSFAKLLPFVVFAGFFKYNLNEVLIIYVILTTFVLFYSFYWNRKLIYDNQ